MDKNKVKEARKYRLYPNNEQKEQIKFTIEASREVWNIALGYCYQPIQELEEIKELPRFKQSKAVYNHLNHMSYENQKKIADRLKDVSVSDIRKKYPRLKQADSSSYSYALRILKQTFSNHFQNPKHFKMPRFKSYKDTIYQGAYSSDARASYLKDEKHLKLNKIKGTEKFVNSYPVSEDARPYKTTIKRDNDEKYYGVIAYEMDEHTVKYRKTGKKVGIDLRTGERGFVTSDGQRLVPPDTSELDKRLRREKRKLSKRYENALKEIARLKNEAQKDPLVHVKELTEFGRYQKQRLKVARLSKRIKNIREYWLKTTAFKLVEEYDFIGIEDLKVSEMTEVKHVKGRGIQKKLNKRLQESNFRTFRGYLEYKAEFTGKTVVAIDQYFASTQLCSSCGYQYEDLKWKFKKQWRCPNCGAHHQTDVNSAQNIYKEALRVEAEKVKE